MRVSHLKRPEFGKFYLPFCVVLIKVYHKTRSGYRPPRFIKLVFDCVSFTSLRS